MEFIVPGGRTAEQSAAACARLLAQWEANDFGAWLLYAGGEPGATPALRASDAAPHFAGVAMLMRDPAGPVELGYALDRPYWGRGLATEVVGALVDVAFRIVDLPGLFARLDPPNVASVRVLVKHGFTLAKETRPEGGRATDWYLLRRPDREASLPPGT
jgi:ribosomal-protein-alanine N-acetyltransferase